MTDKSKNTQSFNLINEGLEDFLSDTRFKDSAKYATTLIYFAWFIEIVAVIIGLTFAVSTLSMALEGRDKTLSVQLNALMGALPWVAAALAELTKIPLAIGFYRTTQRSWKVVFGIALLFLSFITFETMFGGLERNYTLQNYKLTKIEASITTIDSKINENVEEKKIAQNTTNESINEQYNNEITDIINQERKDKQRLKEDNDNNSKRLREMLLLVQEGNTDTIINNLKTEIEDENQDLVARLAKATEIETSNYGRAKIENNEILNTYNQEEKEAKKPVNKKYLINNAQKITKEYRALKQQQREKFQNQTNFFNNYIRQITVSENKISSEKITELKRQIDNQSSLINNADIQKIRLNEIREELESLGDNYQINFQSISERYKIKRNNLDQRVIGQREILAESETIIIQLNKEITENNEEKIKLKESLNVEMNNSQVYRLAHRFFNPNNLPITDIESKVANLVAIFWFGSIAFLIAVMGIILALCSQNLRDVDSFANKELSKNQKTIRSIILDILKSLLKLITSLTAAIVKLIYGILLNVQKFLRNSSAAVWKRMRKPKIKIKYEDREVEVPIKVPVEVKVEKIVEKEIIKWRTRIVQVPLYSSHPGLIDLNPKILSENALGSDGIISDKKNNLSANPEPKDPLESPEPLIPPEPLVPPEPKFPPVPGNPPIEPNSEFKDLGFHPQDGIRVSIRVGNFNNFFIKHGDEKVSIKLDEAHNLTLESAIKILSNNSEGSKGNNND